MFEEATFALVDGATRPDPHDILGLWRTPSPSPGVSFAAADLRRDPPVWRVDLPSHPEEARQCMSAAQGRVADVRARLPAAADRLLTVVAADVPPEASPAELEMTTWLEERRQAATVSFGPPSGRAGWLSGQARVLADLTDRLALSCAPVARVDTRAGDQVLGRSAVGWRGDICSTVGPEASRQDMQLHAAAVALVRSSRATLLRAFGFAVRGALLMVAVVALPGGPLLALPATWRFLNDLLREARR